MNNSSPRFKRIMLKLSGEALMGDQPYGIDPDMLKCHVLLEQVDTSNQLISNIPLSIFKKKFLD